VDKASCDNADGPGVTFLLGAGRSGTTLLYKLLSLHPDIAYISNYENRFKWLPVGWLLRQVAKRMPLKLETWFDHGNAYFVRRPWLKKVVPTPVEGESVYADCGLPLMVTGDYFLDDSCCSSLRRRFEKIRNSFAATIVLSKRTANNRRVPLLKNIFPMARYIHLVRDGRDVARSLSQVGWWDNHILFWDGRSAVELERAGEDRVTVCARNWVMEMVELEKALATIDEKIVYQLCYETLLKDPVGQLAAILSFLGLRMTADYRSAIESLRLEYRPSDWASAWTEDQLNAVLREQKATLQRFGYID
jgi:hypothetical protein